MANYIIRKFDQPTWDAFRARCQAEGHSIRWVLAQLIALYVQEGLGKSPR